MKKILSLMLCAILLGLLFSCGNAPEEELTMPEPTDELIIYNTLYNSEYGGMDVINAARIFREKYPDVKLTIEDFDFTVTSPEAEQEIPQMGEAFQKRITTELLAGSGPDLLIWGMGAYAIGDVEKLLNVDVFENLNPYFDADETFSYDDYVSGVFDAGVRGDKRLFVPIRYTVSMRHTTFETANLWNVEIPEKMDYDAYAEIVQNAYEQMESDDSRWFNNGIDDLHFYLQFYGGFQYIDYENETIAIDPDHLKEFLDLYSPIISLYKERYARGIGFPDFYEGYPGRILGAMHEGKIFEKVSQYLETIATDAGLFSGDGLTPVFYSVPRIGEEKACAYVRSTAAIGKNSKNKVNAYNFLKILLSDEVHGEDEYNGILPPVRKESAQRQFAYAAEVFIRDEVYREQVIKQYMAILSDVEYVNESKTVIMKVLEFMTPYVDGEKPYDECFKELENWLKVYISE